MKCFIDKISDSCAEIYTLFNDHARWHGQRLIFLDNNIPDIYVKSAVFLNSEPNLTKNAFFM